MIAWLRDLAGGATREDRALERSIETFESGSVLMDRIHDAIRLRRSVLVTGPRGSGKTYCAKEAIKRAKQDGLIRDYHFLQGNREIPRDYLSEDVLVLRSSDEDKPPLPVLLDALVIRFPDADERTMRAKRKELNVGDNYPGLTSEQYAVKQDESWRQDEWIVLFLDEINRFGDGFLDSLLSLTEERIVVRGGNKLHVPIVVVATANPPGYDVTAKKLSPPLQARISRSYRVSQPGIETLTYLILARQLAEYRRKFFESKTNIFVPLSLARLACGASLCLWGNPDLERKGVGFLGPDTRRLLEQVMEADSVIAADMTKLGQLVAFGPDARSVGDWVGAAMGVARTRCATTPPDPNAIVTVTPNDLLASAVESLAHKVRENFNEGAEPQRVAEKEQLIHRIVGRALTLPSVQRLLDAPHERAVAFLRGESPEEVAGSVFIETADPRDLSLPTETVCSLIDQLAGPGRRPLVHYLAALHGLPLPRERRAASDALRKALLESRRAETGRTSLGEQPAATVADLGMEGFIALRHVAPSCERSEVDRVLRWIGKQDAHPEALVRSAARLLPGLRPFDEAMLAVIRRGALVQRGSDEAKAETRAKGKTRRIRSAEDSKASEESDRRSFSVEETCEALLCVGALTSGLATPSRPVATWLRHVSPALEEHVNYRLFATELPVPLGSRMLEGGRRLLRRSSPRSTILEAGHLRTPVEDRPIGKYSKCRELFTLLSEAVVRETRQPAASELDGLARGVIAEWARTDSAAPEEEEALEAGDEPHSDSDSAAPEEEASEAGDEPPHSNSDSS